MRLCIIENFMLPLWSKKRQIMLGKLVDKNQCEIFRTRFEDLINPNHELALFGKCSRLELFLKGV